MGYSENKFCRKGMKTWKTYRIIDDNSQTYVHLLKYLFSWIPLPTLSLFAIIQPTQQARRINIHPDSNVTYCLTDTIKKTR